MTCWERRSLVTPEPGVCDIWVTSAIGDSNWAMSLAETDRQEIARTTSPAHAAQITTSRGMLRAVLSAYCGLSGEYIPIDRTCTRCGDPAHGKPTLAGPLEFSVTHTPYLIAVAVTLGNPVGLDAEALCPLGQLRDIAALLLTPMDQLRVAQLPTDEQATFLLEHWVRWEAQAKLHGHGIAELWSPHPSILDTDRSNLQTLTYLDGHIAAIATAQPLTTFRLYKAEPLG